MCLDTITSRNPKKTGIGWKGLGKIDSNVFSSLCQGNYNPMEEGRWLNERDFRRDKKQTTIPTFDLPDNAYPMGWHIYLKFPRGFRYAATKKVKYRGAHTLGIQVGIDVIVSKEILIIKSKRR